MHVAIIIPANGRQSLLAALSALATLNCLYLETHPRAPRLYDSGIRYAREPEGAERWLTYPLMMRLGLADCEDLAAARVAELRVRDREAARFHLTKSGSTWHVQVRRANGQIEDPSRILGMGSVEE